MKRDLVLGGGRRAAAAIQPGRLDSFRRLAAAIGFAVLVTLLGGYVRIPEVVARPAGPYEPGPAAAADVVCTPGSLSLQSTNGAGTKGNQDSYTGVLSADGSTLAFWTLASNLDAADTDTGYDVYVKDLATGGLTLVSRAAGGGRLATDVWRPSLSADGSIVAFVARNGTLESAVYVREVADVSTLTLASVSSDGGTPANRESSDPTLSADGRYLVFVSNATNQFHPDDDTGGFHDVFRKDLLTGQLDLVSQRADGVNANHNSGSNGNRPTIAADGSLVAFESIATNLDPNASDFASDVYVKDLDTGALTLVSESGGVGGDGESRLAAISADGTSVAFWSSATNLVAGDENGINDLYLRDLETGTISLVSVDSEGESIDVDVFYSENMPAISPDGSKVAFAAQVTVFDPTDGDTYPDIYLKDITTGGLSLISRVHPGGDNGNRQSFGPSMADDGRSIAFWSTSTNLSPADASDLKRDVYLVACEGDADGDGVIDGTDNCATVANADQLNTDEDELGDACDDDDDGDTVDDASDNCPLVANPEQDDADADGLGDACDTDDDNDTVADASDNCPLVANPEQDDADADGLGDACDEAAPPITVDTETDELTVNGTCSLREAVIAANTNVAVDSCAAGSPTEADVIVVPAGTYALTIPGTSEDVSADGDLDLTEDVTIEAAGTVSPIIDGTGTNENVFQIVGTTSASLNGLTVTGGTYGIVVEGTLGLNFTTVADNGTGVFAYGDASVTVASSWIRDNDTGIESYATTDILWSTVSGNGTGIIVDGDAGQLFAPQVIILNTTISGNSGAGLSVGSYGNADVSFSTVAFNGTGVTILARATEPLGIFVHGSIVARNGVDCDTDVLPNNSQNLASDASCFTFAIQNTDPKLGRLRVNPAPDETYTPTPTHALLYGSPARDALGETFGFCPATDQRLFDRPLDGTGDGTEVCDFGAYEADTLTGTPFTDIGASIFQTEIGWLYHAAVTLGCNVERTLFCPFVTVTREQMASFLVRALDLPPATEGDHFVDDEGSVHENDINALFEAEITSGCGTDTVPGSPTLGQPLFCPQLDVTREQMASFIARGLAYAGTPLPEPTDDYFDDDEASVFHENDINKMYEAGITLGCGGRNYCPSLPVTRDQMAAFLYRALSD